MNHDIKGCQYGSKLPICPICQLFESWLKSLLLTYWVPPSYIKFQSNPSSWSLDIRLHNFGSNWVPTVHFPQDIFFWENCLLLLSTHCVLSYYILKKIIREKIIRQDCIVLAQIGPKLPFQPKGNFLEKLTNVALIFYIPSCNIISKKSSDSRSWE